MESDVTELRMQQVEINYYCKGELIATAVFESYPPYEPGETIELQLQPTERDLKRTPRKIQRTFFIIDKVNHVIKETGRPSKALLVGMDVLLLEPDEISEKDAQMIREVEAATIKKRRN